MEPWARASAAAADWLGSDKANAISKTRIGFVSQNDGRAQHFILAASPQTATADAIAPVLSEFSPADDLIDSIAELPRSRLNMAEAAQATANTRRQVPHDRLATTL